MAQKYSAEFKLKVVCYARENLVSLREVARKFDVPHKLIHHWLQLFEHQGVEAFYRQKTKRYFPMKFKIKLVNLVLQGETMEVVSLKNGLTSQSILSRWMKNYYRYGIHGLYAKPLKSQQKPRKKMEETLKKRCKNLERENEFLRAKIAYMEMVNAVLVEEGKMSNRKKPKSSKDCTNTSR